MFLAAVLSGAIFGDHASPISDTTVVASMAAATDHIDHVRTQLPYALISAAIALLAFLLTSFLMK
jgi:Na+/H+ antiporter NhaC